MYIKVQTLSIIHYCPLYPISHCQITVGTQPRTSCSAKEDLSDLTLKKGIFLSEPVLLPVPMPSFHCTFLSLERIFFSQRFLLGISPAATSFPAVSILRACHQSCEKEETVLYLYAHVSCHILPKCEGEEPDVLDTIWKTHHLTDRR